MAVFPGWEFTRGPDEIAPIPEYVSLFMRIEGLIGEERRLLAIAENDRSEQQRGILRDISAELDRIWESLRRRAEQVREREEPA